MESNVLELYMSINGLDFNKALFPPGTDLQKNGYTLLESSTGTAFVDVHTNAIPGKEMGMLIESDSTGYKFSLSLRHTNRDGNGQSDFEKMQGLPGIVLSNVVSNHDDVSLGTAIKKIRTLISFDDGGEWVPLQPPSVRADGTSIVCDPLAGCSLHLVGVSGRVTRTTDTGAFFSSSGAVGLAMGVGNVGTSLGAYQDGNTYLTNDAGMTWIEVRRGPHKFEFGDRGALIVIVNDKDPTDHVRYSWDEGRTWESYTFTVLTKKMTVLDLLTYEDATTERFLLVGTFPNDSGEYTLMLDFSDLHQSVCAASDFEMWTPTDYSGGVCHLGSAISYQRRKSTSRCSISTPFAEPVTMIDRCPCTVDDFECDVEYYRDGTTCVRFGGDIPQPDGCLIGTTYTVASGYRHIPSSACRGGMDLTQPLQKTCQAATSSPPTAEPPTIAPPTNAPPTNQPTTPTTSTPTPSLEGPTTSHSDSKNTVSPGAWAAIVLVPLFIIVAFAGALIYRKRYGDFRMPKFFQRVRYMRVGQDDGDMLLDDY